MRIVICDGVPATIPDDMAEEEAAVYVVQEQVEWKARGKELGRVTIRVEGDDVIIESKERSPICRIRRITGYLSEVNNFNSSKRAELDARVNHAEG